MKNKTNLDGFCRHGNSTPGCSSHFSYIRSIAPMPRNILVMADCLDAIVGRGSRSPIGTRHMYAHHLHGSLRDSA